MHGLSHYVACTAGLRQTQQLFVHYLEHSQGSHLSKQRLVHWLYEVVTQAYARSGPPTCCSCLLHLSSVFFHSSPQKAYFGL